MDLPVRLGLQVGSDGPTCAFTAFLPFAAPPGIGHWLIVKVPDPIDWIMRVRVTDICHFLGNEESCLVTVGSPMMATDYDQLLTILDWFKATYKAEDISGSAEPEGYYRFYRSLLHVLDLTHVPSPTVGFEPEEIKLFAEACRAVVLAESQIDQDALNDMIVALHRMVSARKPFDPDGTPILGIVKVWEGRITKVLGELAWAASPEECIAAARSVFLRIKSIPPEKLPKTLRN